MAYKPKDSHFRGNDKKGLSSNLCFNRNEIYHRYLFIYLFWIISPLLAYAIHPFVGACQIKTNLGYPCPGCGLGSGLYQLFHGNLSEAFTLYPALIPLILWYLWGIFCGILFFLKKKTTTSFRIFGMLGVIVAISALGNWMVNLLS